MAKKKKKISYGKLKTKLNATQKAQNFAAKYGITLDETDINQIRADYTAVAKGKYKGKLTGVDIAKTYMTQRTPEMYLRDWEAARRITGEDISEEDFIRNIDAYDADIAAQIDEIRDLNQNLSGSEIAHLVSVHVFGSPD